MGYRPHRLVWLPLTLLWFVGCPSVVFAVGPVFVGLPGTETIPEDSPVGVTVTTLTATDSDTPLASLTFSLVTTTPYFEVVGQDLKVKQAFDLDVAGATTVYTLNVQVFDGSTADIGIVTVTITNVNDETPVITYTSQTASVAEGLSAGASVTFAGLTATDKDNTNVASFDQLTYVLEGTDSSKFHIDYSTGAITTAQLLDRETKSVYDQLVFKVSDAATSPHTATASLTVSVTDINDVTPSCSPSIYYASVNENTGAGVSLATLTCTDTDEGTNGQYDLSKFSGDPGGVFDLSGAQVQTGTTATNYETAQAYTLVIRLIDKPASGTPNTGTATVVVSVIGLNDNNPAWATWNPSAVFISGKAIAENTAIGTSLFTVSASDADLGTGGSIVYSLDSVVDSECCWDTGLDEIGGNGLSWTCG